jgi:hypothetical protein
MTRRKGKITRGDAMRCGWLALSFLTGTFWSALRLSFYA